MRDNVIGHIPGYGIAVDGNRTKRGAATTGSMWIVSRVSGQVPFQNIPAPVARCPNDQVFNMPLKITPEISRPSYPLLSELNMFIGMLLMYLGKRCNAAAI